MVQTKTAGVKTNIEDLFLLLREKNIEDLQKEKKSKH
jgi:hypothetical protein